jgi:hypothetical protein
VLPALLPPFATVPVLDGRMMLGTWRCCLLWLLHPPAICLVDTNGDNPVRRVRFSFLAG